MSSILMTCVGHAGTQCWQRPGCSAAGTSQQMNSLSFGSGGMAQAQADLPSNHRLQ